MRRSTHILIQIFLVALQPAIHLLPAFEAWHPFISTVLSGINAGLAAWNHGFAPDGSKLET